MIIPVVPVRSGFAFVQESCGDVSDWVEKLKLCGQVVLYDTENGKNASVVARALTHYPCRIYCGRTDRANASALLDAGCTELIVDLEGLDNVLPGLPWSRIVVQISINNTEKWTADVVEKLKKVPPDCKHVLLHFSPELFPNPPIPELKSCIKPAISEGCSLSIYCSLTSSHDVALLHSIGVDIYADSAILKDEIRLGELLSAPLISDRPDGFFPTIVTDEHGVALGLVYSSRESICEAVRTRRGVYQSRKRGLWYKGDTSGDIQELLRISIDCDSDCVKFVVRQHGNGFCHLLQRSCFGSDTGIPALMRTLESRKRKAPEGSYTQRLFNDESLLCSKLLEEAGELNEADAPDEVAWEAADVIYFTLVKCAKAGVSLADVEKILDQRALKVKRRKGDAKEETAALLSPPPTAPTAPALEDTLSCHTIYPLKQEGISDIPLKCFVFSDMSSKDCLALCQRPAQSSASSVYNIVAPIMNDVRKRGDLALVELTKKFDKVDLESPVVDLSKISIESAAAALSPEIKSAIDKAWHNVHVFHAAQLEPKPLVVETAPGVVCSRHVRSIEKVGLYVPGGSAVLPSTAIMLGVPAKVAGCREIVLASPPNSSGSVSHEILYIAKKMNAKCVLLAGGAQAIAAMAYGTKTVPKVDKICGPGNQFVTAAKLLVQNDASACVSIDMPAGPSEVMVIADNTASSEFVAADLLSQAEHGPDSQVVLVSYSMTDAKMNDIVSELSRQLDALPRRDVARRSIAKSFLMVTSNAHDASAFANMYAPEHLIINTEKPGNEWIDLVQNAGSLFLGPFSTESCGDYASGTNHTLPTYGYARMYSGVSTATFQKHLTSQVVTEEGIESIGSTVCALASLEGLEAHRRAVEVRQKFMSEHSKSI